MGKIELRTLLLVDDDEALLVRLALAMETRGYMVSAARSLAEACAIIDRVSPDYAVIDLRLGDGNGLDVIAHLRAVHPSAHAIVLTGYGNIPTAVTAIKLGAVDYLTKPVDADEVDAALQATATTKSPVPDRILPPDDAQLQHILSFLEANDGQLSPTARQLGMHRRTLQRILRRNGIPPSQ